MGSSSAPNKEGEPDTATMDACLQECFLSALLLTNDSELPIAASEFYTERVNMFVSRPGVALDWRASSFKKMSKFLAFLVKARVIDTKESGGLLMISRIHRDAPLFRNFEPLEMKAASHGAKATGSATSSHREPVVPVQVVELLRPLRHPAFCEMCTASGRFPAAATAPDESLELYLKKDIADVFSAYLRGQRLQDPAAKANVLVDAFLGSACSLPDAVGRSVPRAEVSQAFFTKFFVPYFAVLRPGAHRPADGSRLLEGAAIFEGLRRPVVCTVERRIGSRVVSALQNVEVYVSDMEAFVNDCQHFFAASVSVSDAPRYGGHAVIVQGDIRKRLGAFLKDRYGIPPGLLEMVCKFK